MKNEKQYPYALLGLILAVLGGCFIGFLLLTEQILTFRPGVLFWYYAGGIALLALGVGLRFIRRS